MRRIFLAAFIVLYSVTGPLQAQVVAPLIREEKPIEVKVKPRDEAPLGKNSPIDEAKTPTPTPAPTPDPKLVVVAVVNNHSITRAQLDSRVSARINSNDRAQMGESTAMSLFGNEAMNLDMSLVEFEQAAEFEEALRQEEGRVISEWQEQMILSDEARRQGFVITNEQLQTRLTMLDKEYQLQSHQVRNLLESMGMTREELESYVYDALLIERLLERFVELNFSEDDLRKAYQKNPGFYQTPPGYEIAHFCISLLGDETRTTREGFKKDAEKVRRRLKDGEDPETVFDSVNDIGLGVYGTVITWSTNSKSLHPAVKAELAQMKEGEISKVIAAQVMRDGKPTDESYHVVKLIRNIPRQGETFESALPRLRESAMEAARMQLLNICRESGTHKRITNLRGIRPDKLPTPSELRTSQPPVNLKVNNSGEKS